MSSPVISLGSWGGPGGDRWSCIARNGIAKITIREHAYIESFSFIDASGVFSGTFGSTTNEEKKIAINWPSEYLMSISGTYGDYHGLQVILSLSFITNLTTYGPFGDHNKGQSFSTPITDNVVVGFFGRSGQFLDAIGIHVQPMNATRISLGPWGGEGGDDRFSFNVDPSFIKRITVRHKECIKSILLQDSNDHRYGPFGGQHPQDTDEEAQIEIGNFQRLTSISGTYGKYAGLMVITSLSFHINDSTIKGPYGAQTGTSFSIPIHGSEVIGIFGRSGWYLDSIGLYIKQQIIDH